MLSRLAVHTDTATISIVCPVAMVTTPNIAF